MDSTGLNKLLSPFAILANRGALAPHYRAIELAPDHVKAVASFGMLDVAAELDINDVAYVDASAFIAIVKSLPEGDVHLSMNNGVLTWKCGNADGRLAVLTMPLGYPETPQHQFDEFPVSADLPQALKLGGLSADENAIGVEAVYGITLDNRETLMVTSTDNLTASAYEIDAIVGGPPLTTIAPKAGELLAAIAKPNGVLEFGEHSLHYFDDTSICRVGYVKPLPNNVRDNFARFEEVYMVAAIPPDRIAAFVKRATALAENRRNAQVSLCFSDNRLAFSFEEATAATDEFYMTQELQEFGPIEPVRVNAVKIARAMQYSKEVVLDFAEPAQDRGTLVIFRGDSFSYFVSAHAT